MSQGSLEQQQWRCNERWLAAYVLRRHLLLAVIANTALTCCCLFLAADAGPADHGGSG